MTGTLFYVLVCCMSNNHNIRLVVQHNEKKWIFWLWSHLWESGHFSISIRLKNVQHSGMPVCIGKSLSTSHKHSFNSSPPLKTAAALPSNVHGVCYYLLGFYAEWWWNTRTPTTQLQFMCFSIKKIWFQVHKQCLAEVQLLYVLKHLNLIKLICWIQKQVSTGWCFTK